MKTNFSENLSINIWGGSHEEAMYLEIIGLPEGILIDEADISPYIEQRKSTANNPLSTKRREDDIPLIFVEEKSSFLPFTHFQTKSKLKFKVENKDYKSQDYNLRYPRPGHCDLVAYHRFGKNINLQGGGPFSGRMTLMLVIAGAICNKVINHYYEDINIGAKLVSLGKEKVSQINYLNPQDTEEIQLNKLFSYINQIKKGQDSLGGKILAYATGLPIGLGGPLFNGLDSLIAKLIFSIPGAKGLEFGKGLEAATILGSQNNDQYLYYNENPWKILTKTNNCGGILGGMSTSMPLVFSVYFKPTPSIGLEQKTIDLKENDVTNYTIKGRHDIAFVTRVSPVVKSALSIAILDRILEFSSDPNSFSSHRDSSLREDANKLTVYRNKVDIIDKKIENLLNQRMEISKDIGKYKEENQIQILDKNREKELINKISPQYKGIFKEIIKLSKEKQKSN